MKAALVFFLSLIVGFFGIFLFDTWQSGQATEEAKKSIEPAYQKISFDVAIAPTDSLKGTMTDLIGEVMWESRTASSPSLLRDQVELQQGEMIETSENSSVDMIIPGAVSMEVSENTKLSFIQTLPKSIVLGQGKGVVAYTKLSDSSISVRSMHLLVVQESGSMTVSVDDEESVVSVTVYEGRAAVAYNDPDNVVSKVSLGEGQRYIFDDLSRTGEIIE